MTKAQEIIINLIRAGAKNSTIVAFTGRSAQYVSHVRTLLMEDENYFQNNAVKNAIQNAKRDKKKSMVDYSGRVECLKCEGMFNSEDRRHNRICPKCSHEKINIAMPDCGQVKSYTHRQPME